MSKSSLSSQSNVMADQFSEFLVRDKGRWTFSNIEGHQARARDLQSRLAASRRYIIEDDAVEVAGVIARSNAEILAGLLSGARPPAARTWFEWSDLAQARSTGFNGEPDAHNLFVGALIETEPTEPNRFTVELFMKDWVGQAHGARSDGYVFVCVPLGFIVDTDNSLRPADRTSENMLAHCLGTTTKAFSIKLVGLPLFGPLTGMVAGDPEFYDKHSDFAGYREHRMRVDNEGRPKLSQSAMEKLDLTVEEIEARYQSALRIVDHVAHRLTKDARLALEKLPGQPSQVQQATTIAFGELSATHSPKLAFILALLALLNSPELVDASTTSRAGKSRSVGAKTLPYFEHRVVRLKLTRKIAIEREVRRIIGRMPPRRHEVNGHWAVSQRRGRQDCDHAWISLTANRQTCGLCEGLRWWVASHERGLEKLGRVVTDHRVTK